MANSTILVANSENIQSIRRIGDEYEVLLRSAKGLTFGELCRQIEVASKAVDTAE